MNTKELKLLWPFYLGILIAGITNATEAIYVVFFLSKELPFIQISILVSLFAFGRLFFEIPTGAVADTFGRKRSVVLGWIGNGITFAMIPFFNTFTGLFTIILINTFFSTFVTGADNAWVIDYLKYKKQEKYIKNYFAHTETIWGIAFFFAGIIATLLLNHYALPMLFYIAGLGSVVTGLILLIPKEHFRRKKTTLVKETTKGVKTTKKAVIYAFTHRTVRNITLGMFFFSLMAISWVAWEPLFLQENIPVKYFPLILSSAFLFSAFCAYVSKNLVNKFTKVKTYLNFTAFITATIHILVFFILGPIYAVLAFILKYGTFSLYNPIKQNLFHKFIPSKLRATIDSTDSMVIGIGIALAAILGGWFMDLFGPNITIMLTGMLILPSIFFNNCIKEKRKKLK